jgi:signal transduction histidine kinase
MNLVGRGRDLVIEPRLLDTERTLVTARWLVLPAVVVVAHLLPAGQVHLLAVYGLVAAAALYNLAYMVLLWRRFVPPVVTEITVFIELLFVAAVMGASGGRDSALAPLLLWPVIGAAFRLGLPEALAAAALGSLACAYFNIFTFAGLDLARVNEVLLCAIYLFAGAIVTRMLFDRAYGAAEHGLASERQAARDAVSKLTAVRAQSQAIAEVSTILSSTLNYQRVLETILSEFHKLLGFQVGIVFLFEANSSTLRVATGRGLVTAERQIHISASQGQVGKVVQQGEPLPLTSMGQDEELRQFASLAELKSGLCVPLHAGFEMYGAVLVAAKESNVFTATHLDLLMAFCNQAVLAMQNAQLYENLRRERDRVVDNDEESRRKVARDLHDGPVQLVAAMAMKAEVIKRMAKADPARMPEELDALAEMSHRASRDLRTVLFELRPVMLDSHGLVATLKEYVQKLKETQNVPLRLDASGFDRRLPPKTESTVFAILQEAINNAQKHAEAKNIWLRLAERDKTLVAVVEDDGAGFDLASVEDSYGQRGSLGLLNMRERAEMVDGMLTVRSVPGFGTTVTLRVSLPDASIAPAQPGEARDG